MRAEAILGRIEEVVADALLDDDAGRASYASLRDALREIDALSALLLDGAGHFAPGEGS